MRRLPARLGNPLEAPRVLPLHTDEDPQRRGRITCVALDILGLAGAVRRAELSRGTLAQAHPAPARPWPPGANPTATRAAEVPRDNATLRQHRARLCAIRTSGWRPNDRTGRLPSGRRGTAPAETGESSQCGSTAVGRGLPSDLEPSRATGRRAEQPRGCRDRVIRRGSCRPLEWLQWSAGGSFR
jgi:hypothetical protein